MDTDQRFDNATALYFVVVLANHPFFYWQRSGSPELRADPW